MIVPIELCDPPEGEDSTKTVHYLTGCSIDYSGPANVDTYFKPSETSSDQATAAEDEKKRPCHKTAYFRGRLMKGIDVAVPSGYTMYVCNESGEDIASQDTEDGTSTAPKYSLTPVTAKEFTMWKHHVSPDMETDSFIKGLDWPSLASVLHES